MSDHTECQSYSSGMVCKSGFVQKPICRGYGACVYCGLYSHKSTPNCMKDDLSDIQVLLAESRK